MVTAWLISALTLCTPVVQLTDAQACVASEQLHSELAALLPDAQVKVEVTTGVAAEDDVTLTLRVMSSLDGGDPAQMLLERTLTVVRSDCSAVAPLLARIVSRRLESLPRHRWERPRSTVSAEEHDTTTRVSLFVEGGASVGLDQPDPRGHLTIGMVGELWEGLVGLLGVSGALTHTVNVGAGEARLASATLWLGLGWRGEAGSVQWMPHVAVNGGLAFGQGVGFDDNKTALMPTVEGSVGLTLITPASLHVTLAADVPFVSARLLEAGTSSSYEEPRIRLRLGVGVTWP